MGSAIKGLLAVLGGLVLLLAAASLLVDGEQRRAWCAKIGICEEPDFVGAMVESVRREQKLVVFSARLVVPVTSGRDTTIGPLTVATTQQTAILPGRVNYSLDLSTLSEADLSWDAERRVMTVLRPSVRIEQPTIQWDKAKIYADKGWQTAVTDVSTNLQRDNERKAPGQFQKQSRDPELVRLAENAADHALSTLFSMPLHAAGFRDAKVVVKRKDR